MEAAMMRLRTRRGKQSTVVWRRLKLFCKKSPYDPVVDTVVDFTASFVNCCYVVQNLHLDFVFIVLFVHKK